MRRKDIPQPKWSCMASAALGLALLKLVVRVAVEIRRPPTFALTLRTDITNPEQLDMQINCAPHRKYPLPRPSICGSSGPTQLAAVLSLSAWKGFFLHDFSAIWREASYLYHI